MMSPLISVLIPCYNADRWLAATLKSVLNQTWQQTEIILVDDGSTDQSWAIAQSFSSTQIKTIRQSNRGASAARNRALQEAQGEYIQYLDADDLLSPNKLEAQLLQLQQHPPQTLAVCGTVHFWDEAEPSQGKLEADLRFLTDSNQPIDWLIRLLGGKGEGSMVHPAAWLTPRSTVEAVGGWNETLSLDDDGEYFARVVLASTGICYCADSMSYYRKFRQGQSLSGSKSTKDQWSALRSIDLKAQHLFRYSCSSEAKRAIARCYMERAVQAYPDYPEVTAAALQCIRQLKIKPDFPSFGGWRGELLRTLLGWKMARQLSVTYHRWRTS